MRRAALLLAALSVACSEEPRRTFTIGLLAPVSSRVVAEAGRLGLPVSDRPPLDAVVEHAGIPKAGGAGATADWETLRFFGARAAVRGTGGLFFRLPSAPEGRDLLDYPEEWQAVIRAARESAAMKPVLEGGTVVSTPFPVPEGVEARAWAYRGRRYVLLVNVAGGAAPFDAAALAPWRALFEVRSDARQVLSPCGGKFCLAPRAPLWLEGRLFE